MDEIVDGLFVGTVEDAGDETLLREHDISIVVSLTHQGPNEPTPPDVTVVNIPMIDGPRNDPEAFEQAVTTVCSYLAGGDRLLIHCSAGASRSPAVATTAIALTTDLDLAEAFEQLRVRRDAVDPHSALVRRAASAYTNLRD